jgi:hypothetical protein
MRYDIYELTDIFQNFASDLEFKAMLAYGLNIFTAVQKNIIALSNMTYRGKPQRIQKRTK